MENGSSAANLPRVGFSIGEPGGIGPQLLLQFLAQEGWQESFIPIIFGHRRIIERWRGFCGISTLRYHLIKSPTEAEPQKINLIECTAQADFTLGKPSGEGGYLAREAFRASVQAAQSGNLSVLVTLPVDKSTFFHETEFPYRGHTEYLRAASPTPPLMMMVSENLRIAVLTEHIPLRAVHEHIHTEALRWAIETLNRSLREDFAVASPRIAVLGLNPHAGDSGLIGTEEKEILAPLLTDFWRKGYYISGPFSPDGFFAGRLYRDTDAVLALYHDQGLIPFKILAGWEGFQYSAGLSFVRTAPDHGVAYDKVGSAEVDSSSLQSAIWEGLAIARRRAYSLSA
ncbi:MAG: 4-hydroxythreonine-4-phosphate dehydrogenase PdxA [Bacteroidia bacterium]|nr:4-hydroxythreonine-4-phosphate dehydrogenase PdxA [Bacteroidia bacterium]MDW8236081.1 4-hydroxythreonine-4-phosphate dehydrogenase PdxA [Bacteroidia bacterium]